MNLPGTPGIVSDVLTFLHVVPCPAGWLDGQPVTVVLRPVRGCIPAKVLPLFTGLDR